MKSPPATASRLDGGRNVSRGVVADLRNAPDPTTANTKPACFTKPGARDHGPACSPWRAIAIKRSTQQGDGQTKAALIDAMKERTKSEEANAGADC